MPVGRQAVAVPGFGQSQALGEGEDRAAGNFPDAAPAGDVFFRPEEQHGLSGEYHILVPARGGNGEMDDAWRLEETAIADAQFHGGIATGTSGGDASVAPERGGDGQGVPDATGPPGAFAGLNSEGRGHGPKGSGA